MSNELAGALSDVFRQVFDRAELRAFIGARPEGKQILRESVTEQMTDETYLKAVVSALQRRNAINRTLLQDLLSARSGQARIIQPLFRLLPGDESRELLEALIRPTAPPAFYSHIKDYSHSAEAAFGLLLDTVVALAGEVSVLEPTQPIFETEAAYRDQRYRRPGLDEHHPVREKRERYGRSVSLWAVIKLENFPEIQEFEGFLGKETMSGLRYVSFNITEHRQVRQVHWVFEGPLLIGRGVHKVVANGEHSQLLSVAEVGVCSARVAEGGVREILDRNAEVLRGVLEAALMRYTETTEDGLAAALNPTQP